MESPWTDGAYDVFSSMSLLGGVTFWLLLLSAGGAIIASSRNGLKGAEIAVGVVFALFILLLLLALWKTKNIRFYKTENMQLASDAKEKLQ